jgi:hypothetical protein
VELAFQRMDRNRDSFLTWEEFDKVSGELRIEFGFVLLIQ